MKIGPGAKTVFILAGVIIVIAGLKAAAALIVPLITAVFITVVSLPMVRWLSARRVPRPLAILLSVLFNISIFAAIAGLVGGSLNEFYDRVPHYQARLTALTAQTADWLDAQGLRIDSAEMARMSESLQLMGLVAELFRSLANLVSKALIVSLLVLFMLFEAGPWRVKVAYVVGNPSESLPRFAVAASEVQTYLVVKSGLSVVTGGLCGAWVAICGVDFALIWGLLAFVLNYVPTLGMFIATIPPVLVALIQLGPGPALLLLGGYLVINFILGNFVEPRVMGRALGLSPLVVFVSMVFWGWLWGPLGALLAVPLTMVCKILLANTEDLRWAAVLLGSAEWLAEKRRDWADPVEDELRRSEIPPPPGAASTSTPSLDGIPELEGKGSRTPSRPGAGGDDPSDAPLPQGGA